MSVSDSGNEVLRKSAIVLDGGVDNHTDRGSEYVLRVVNSQGNDICDPGISLNGRISVATVTDSAWTQLVITPLANRVSLLIQNQSATSPMYFNYVEAATPSESWQIPANLGHYGVTADADSTMTFYVRMPAGAGNAQVVINEVGDE